MLSNEEMRYREERKYYQMELKAAREELSKCQPCDMELLEMKIEQLENFIDKLEVMEQGTVRSFDSSEWISHLESRCDSPISFVTRQINMPFDAESKISFLSN